jgi:hypothetical protein
MGPIFSGHRLEHKGKNTHIAERGGAERPAACDLCFGKYGC